jgi:hypothetical protein
MRDMKEFVKGQLVGSAAWKRGGRRDVAETLPFSEYDKSVVTDHTRKAINLDMYSIRASYVL